MDHRGHAAPPAARTDGLLVEHIEGETVVYDVERKAAHALSPLASAVFAEADGRRTLAELAELASERAGRPVTEEQAWDALVELEESALLEAPTGGFSRRTLVRRGAVVAAIPLVTSVAMPSLALAASCNIGSSCTSDAQCGSLMTTKCSDLPGDGNSCGCYTGATTAYTGPPADPMKCDASRFPVTYTQNTCQFI